MGREHSPTFKFNPPSDLTDGDSYSVDLTENSKYRAWVPYDWLEVTNSSGYPVSLYLDGEPKFTVYGRLVKTMSGRPFTQFEIRNSSGETITSTDIEILIQKGGRGG